MEEKNEAQELSNAYFFELIKDDSEAIADYKKEVEELFTRRVYSEDQVIKIYTRKTKAEVFSELTIPQLNRMNWVIDFLMDNPCGLMYIQKLEMERKKKNR
ncbi:MAG: hypothetical protein ACXVPU_02670 [Bacteroidia bacterium]